MSISKSITFVDLVVSDINIEIVRKDIKNLHLAVYPPDGHVCVVVPKKPLMIMYALRSFLALHGLENSKCGALDYEDWKY